MKRLVLAALFLPALALDACSVSEPTGAPPIPEEPGRPSNGNPPPVNTAPPGNGGNEPAPAKPALFAFVGSSDGKIHTYSVDGTTGAWNSLKDVPAGKTPWFAAFDPARNRVVAIDDDSATVQSFTFDAKTGTLTPVNSKPTGGAGPVHVSLDPSGKWVMVANFGGGNVTVRPVDETGLLGDTTDTKPSGGGSHWAGTDPLGTDVFVSAVDRNVVAQYRFDSTTGKLAENGWSNPPPGCGPRHLAIHPTRKWGYTINRNGANVTAYFFDPNYAGKIWPIDQGTVSALPENQSAEGASGSEIVMHPSGKWVYASTRGYNSIATFEVDETTGKLKLVKSTPTDAAAPRSFAIDPEGTLLFAGNVEANHVVGFKIDPAGVLTPLGKTVDVAGPSFVGLARFQ